MPLRYARRSEVQAHAPLELGRGEKRRGGLGLFGGSNVHRKVFRVSNQERSGWMSALSEIPWQRLR